MRLVAVELRGFRNLHHVLVEPHPRLTVLCGDNGQGKTNFLEGVYLVASLRSFRTTRVDELVEFGATETLARARVERRGLERLYEVAIAGTPRRKTARVDGKTVRTGEYFGGFNVILFAPDDLRLVRGAPAERRRFLDRAVWNAVPAFLGEAQVYERVLKSRNALLRDARIRQDPSLLSVYDEQLARAGAVLIARRQRFLDELTPRVHEAFERITRSGLPLAVSYSSKIEAPEPELESALLARLVETRRRDLDRGHTGAGPHHDDLELLLDGKPARLHASQGQTRAIVLALKIAEIEHLDAVLGEPPILLLDDVSSELDAERTRHLFDFVAALGCQAFVTTTAPEHLPLAADRRQLQVISGTVRG